ncbi:MAG TPA: IS1182 family transposase [Chloroflexota bacterium]|nr:IS1182 family transposase [Chloroflexota bacterium]
MMGFKSKNLKTYTSFSLEDLVPEGNFYRQVEQCIDLSFVRDLVRHLYADFGRPSVDPVVFFKLQLIAFFEGIRSERLLMETVRLNIAHRWFIGYDLDETVPDHSSLSKIRERYGIEVFQKFFEHIVELCADAGLVWGEELYFDSTKVDANAAITSMIDRTEYEAGQHLEKLWENDEKGTLSGLVEKYNGQRLTGSRKPSYKRLTDEKVSPTDPDAAPMRAQGGGTSVLGYRDHYIVDGGKARIILSALVAPASITDNTPLLDMVDWVCSRWELEPKIAAGDTRYGTIPNVVGLEERGIKAYLPFPDLSGRTEYYSSDLFQYDAERDLYICPQKHKLPLMSRRMSEEKHVYRADAEECNACPVKEKCTASRSGRHIFRSIFQEHIDKVKAYHQTEAYRKAMRKRGVWVEPLFGEAKEFHRLRRFRLRGLNKVNIEGMMIAAGQNLKRLVKHGLERTFYLTRKLLFSLSYKSLALFQQPEAL